MTKLLLAAFPLLILAAAAYAEPLPMRVWQFQDYNMDHMKRLVDLAAQNNVNRIQLSHEIVMDVEEPLNNPQLVKDINTVCEWAQAKGIKVDMWTHELNGIPQELLKDGKANLDDPKLWEFVTSKYDKLFKLCPKLDGLVLTMQETAMSIYHEDAVASSITPEKRVARLIDDLAKVCEKFKKDFFVRTFSYEPAELKYIMEGLALCESDPIVMTKCVPHDWQPYYPNNPAIGNVGGKRQIVEFDLGEEFTGLSTVPYIELDHLKRRLDYDLTKNICGAVLRVERLKWRSVDTPNWANIEIFTKMLNDPSADPNELFKEWLGKKYGEDAVPHLYSAFMRTFDIVNKSYFVLGFWVTNHSKVPDYGYATKSLRGRTSAKWDPITKPVEQELFNPTAETIKKIDAEKDEALELVNASIADMRRAKPYLTGENYDYLMNLFLRSKAMVVVWKGAMDIVFGVQVYNTTKSESDERFLINSADRLERLANENSSHLIDMAADYATPQRTENHDKAMGLVKLARDTVEKK